MATKRTTKKAEAMAAKKAAKTAAATTAEVKAESSKAEAVETVAAEAVKTEETVKTAPVKETVKETVKEAANETAKETAKAAPAKEAAPKAEAKKPVRRTKKAAAATAEVYFQYLGKEFASKDLVSDVKKAWIEMTGKKEEDIQDIKVYVKPEENKAYYVVNGEAEGHYIEL